MILSLLLLFWAEPKPADVEQPSRHSLALTTQRENPVIFPLQSGDARKTGGPKRHTIAYRINMSHLVLGGFAPLHTPKLPQTGDLGSFRSCELFEHVTLRSVKIFTLFPLILKIIYT
jgi:hypothetical protein